MIKTFENFINESKNYNLYKGVGNLDSILEDGVIKYSGDWNSCIRNNRGIKDGVGISATRNFSAAKGYGDYIIEFDTQKISDKYKILPFIENLDYILDLSNKGKSTNPISKVYRYKEYGKEFWDIKTNRNAYDHDISEEIIVAKEIPVKYIKKVYLVSDYDKRNQRIEFLLDQNNISYEYISRDDKYLSKIKYKNKVKAHSQL